MQTTRIGEGQRTYEWMDHWARLPDTPSTRENGRTHSVTVSRSGNVYVFCQADPAVVIYSPEGEMIDAWGDRFAGAHGMTRVVEDETDCLWLTDQYSGEVVKTTLDGTTVQNLGKPEHAAYADQAKYSPTWVAVNEPRHGGNGDIWLADGYGQSLVHRYDGQGQYLQTITGEEGAAGRFKCPHGIAFDTRFGKPTADDAELYIADRGNQRVQVYNARGQFLRSTDMGGTQDSPCMFAFTQSQVIVPQLHARITIADKDDANPIVLADNAAQVGHDGWPNVPADKLHPGKANSPHAMAADDQGNLYLVEWIIGGRITKLAKVG